MRLWSGYQDPQALLSLELRPLIHPDERFPEAMFLLSGPAPRSQMIRLGVDTRPKLG